jgi:hypothetical protein
MLSTRPTTEGPKKNGDRQVRSLRLSRPKARSRITNGSSLLPNVDGRTFWVRRYRDLIALHLSDLGGEEAASEGEKALTRRCACLIIELERLEQRFALAGEASPKALLLYQTCANTLRRLLATLGLQRRSRDITPSLAEYLNARRVADDDVVDAETAG